MNNIVRNARFADEFAHWCHTIGVDMTDNDTRRGQRIAKSVDELEDLGYSGVTDLDLAD